MNDIFSELHHALRTGCDTVLVTIVDDDGSAPRGKGSQMLVSAAGRLTGTIGGGAVEAGCIAMAKELLPQKASAQHHFALHPNPGEDIGMVCGGNVTVWLQYIAADDAHWHSLLAQISALFAQHTGGQLVLYADGRAPALLDANGACLVAGHPEISDKPEAKRFVLPLSAGERAVIFGAGHITHALVPILKSVGFRPVVFDCRPELAQACRFPDAERVVCGDYAAIADSLALAPEDYLVVMTHGHLHDFEVQLQVLQKQFAYVGVIGSRAKTAAAHARLLAEGISQQALDRVHTPIGTKIRAVTPEEIAVSIAGEMICVRAEARDGAQDRHHPCPMHE